MSSWLPTSLMTRPPTSGARRCSRRRHAFAFWTSRPRSATSPICTKILLPPVHSPQLAFDIFAALRTSASASKSPWTSPTATRRGPRRFATAAHVCAVGGVSCSARRVSLGTSRRDTRHTAMSSGPTKARHGAGCALIGPTVLPSPEAAQLVGLRPRRRAPALRSVVASGASCCS